MCIKTSLSSDSAQGHIRIETARVTTATYDHLLTVTQALHRARSAPVGHFFMRNRCLLQRHVLAYCERETVAILNGTGFFFLSVGITLWRRTSYLTPCENDRLNLGTGLDLRRRIITAFESVNSCYAVFFKRSEMLAALPPPFVFG